MTESEIAAAFTRIFGGLHPTPQDAFRAGVVVGQTPVQCTPGRHCPGAYWTGQIARRSPPVADRRFNAKLILPDGTEKPSLILYFPPTLTGEEVEDIGRKIISVFSGTLYSDVEDEEGRGTTTEDMLDAGLLDSDGVIVPLEGER
jgi:hypothetical protein